MSDDSTVSMAIRLGMSKVIVTTSTPVTDGHPHTISASLDGLVATIIIDNAETVGTIVENFLNQTTPLKSPVAISLGGHPMTA